MKKPKQVNGPFKQKYSSSFKFSSAKQNFRKKKFGIYRSGFACFVRQVNGPGIKFNKFELPFAAPIQIWITDLNSSFNLETMVQILIGRQVVQSGR